MYESYECCDGYDETGMGILPLAAVPTIGSAISAIGGIFGGNPKDAGRLRTNLELYNRAISGDAAALDQLRAKAAPGGWATAKATNDAKAKLAAALKILAVHTPVMQDAPRGALSAITTGLSLSPVILAGAALGLVLLMRKR